MLLFQRQEPLPIDRLSTAELAESDAFFESHGITKDMAIQDIEATRKLFQELLEKCVNGNTNNKVWVYYLLGAMYLTKGQLQETVSLCSRAALEHPLDPRAYYSLGTIYYGIFQQKQTSPWRDRLDLQDHPLEIRQRIQRIRHFETQNQQLVQAFRESKLAASREEAAKLALQYFRKTLDCNISKEDKNQIQTHIKLIQTQLTL